MTVVLSMRASLLGLQLIFLWFDTPPLFVYAFRSLTERRSSPYHPPSFSFANLYRLPVLSTHHRARDTFERERENGETEKGPSRTRAALIPQRSHFLSRRKCSRIASNTETCTHRDTHTHTHTHTYAYTHTFIPPKRSPQLYYPTVPVVTLCAISPCNASTPPSSCCCHS